MLVIKKSLKKYEKAVSLWLLRRYRFGFIFRFTYVLGCQGDIYKDNGLADYLEIQWGMDHAGRDMYETGFRNDELFLLAFRTHVKPDFGIKIVYPGGIGVLESQELVEIMGVGLVYHQKRLRDAEPIHPVAGVPFFAPDVERGGSKGREKLGEIPNGFAFIILGILF